MKLCAFYKASNELKRFRAVHDRRGEKHTKENDKHKTECAIVFSDPRLPRNRPNFHSYTVASIFRKFQLRYPPRFLGLSWKVDYFKSVLERNRRRHHVKYRK